MVTITYSDGQGYCNYNSITKDYEDNTIVNNKPTSEEFCTNVMSGYNASSLKWCFNNSTDYCNEVPSNYTANTNITLYAYCNKGVDLPSSGGIGNYPFYVLGLFFLLLAIIAMIYRNEKSNN